MSEWTINTGVKPDLPDGEIVEVVMRGFEDTMPSKGSVECWGWGGTDGIGSIESWRILQEEVTSMKLAPNYADTVNPSDTSGRASTSKLDVLLAVVDALRRI